MSTSLEDEELFWITERQLKKLHEGVYFERGAVIEQIKRTQKAPVNPAVLKAISRRYRRERQGIGSQGSQ